MSAQHHGVGVGGGVPPPAKLKVIYGLKMVKTSDLYYKERSFYMYMCTNGWHSWGVGANAPSWPTPK